MSKKAENQDNGLFALDIEPERKTKGRGRWPDKQLSQKPENKPVDIPDSGTNDANINNIDDIDKREIIESNNLDIIENGENQGKSGKEIPLNDKELIFLEKYLIEKESMINAMKLAGYGNVTDRTLSNWGIKITNKYETWAGDARIVFRKAGVGETRLARTADKLLESSNEKTLLGTGEWVSKVLRATADPGDTRQGIAIIINTSAAPTPGPGLPCPPDAGPSVEVKVIADRKPLKPIAITK